MGLKDYDYPDDDYEDPFDTLDGWRRHQILMKEAFDKVRWPLKKRVAWYIALVLSFV
jgi:hypothetical protein